MDDSWEYNFNELTVSLSRFLTAGKVSNRASIFCLVTSLSILTRLALLLQLIALPKYGEEVTILGIFIFKLLFIIVIVSFPRIYPL